MFAFNANANESQNLKAADRANAMSKKASKCYYSVPKNQNYAVKVHYDAGAKNMRYAFDIMKSNPNHNLRSMFESVISSFEYAIAAGKQAGGTSC